MGESRVKTKNQNGGYGLNSNELDRTDGDIMSYSGTLEKSPTTTPRRSSGGASFGSVIKSRQWTASKAVFCPLAVSSPLSARLRAFGFHDLHSPLPCSSGFSALIAQMPKWKFIPLGVCAKSTNITFTSSKTFFYETQQAGKR